jgi:2,4'-dihydroxyacetophenone dioxygenase
LRSGGWGYLEYDWAARPGNYVRESPHAVYQGGTKIVFTTDGILEFLNDDDTRDNTMDCWSFVHLYAENCAINGLEVNQRIFF